MSSTDEALARYVPTERRKEFVYEVLPDLRSLIIRRKKCGLLLLEIFDKLSDELRDSFMSTVPSGRKV
jgi:hypothetical protein